MADPIEYAILAFEIVNFVVLLAIIVRVTRIAQVVVGFFHPKKKGGDSELDLDAVATQLGVDPEKLKSMAATFMGAGGAPNVMDAVGPVITKFLGGEMPNAADLAPAVPYLLKALGSMRTTSSSSSGGMVGGDGYRW
jgi:hypothetical protein